MSNSAFKEININNLGDLIFGPEQSINIPGDSVTIYYQHSIDGAYYKINRANNSSFNWPVWNDATTLNQLAVVLGVTILQSYSLDLDPTPGSPGTNWTAMTYNGTHWQTVANKYTAIEIIRVGSSTPIVTPIDVTIESTGGYSVVAKQVGKYYFNLHIENSGGDLPIFSDSASMNRILTVLGATLNTQYDTPHNVSATMGAYSGGSWTNLGSFFHPYILGFLIN